MRYVTAAAVVTLAMVALVVGFPSQALALPELLGQAANEEYKGKTTAANLTWETTKEEKIICKEMSMEGVQEADTLGTFHMHLTGCESSGFKCNTTGDETGIVLWLGAWHYVSDHLGSGSELGVAILFLTEEVNVKCTALITLKLKGTFLCLVLEPLTSATTHEFHCTESNGKESETAWWNDEGVEQHALFLISKNGGASIESGERMLASTTFSNAVAFMNE